MGLSNDVAVYMRRGEDLVVGLIGGGSHSNLHLMPAFKRYGARLHTVISQTGVSGSQTAKKFEFGVSSTDESTVFSNKDINSEDEILQVHFIYSAKLVGELLWSAVNVRVVHLHRTHAHEAHQFAGALVAVAGAIFGQA